MKKVTFKDVLVVLILSALLIAVLGAFNKHPVITTIESGETTYESLSE